MKTTKIIYWVSTMLIFIFEGVMPALTSHTEMAREGISHLGYPPYFGTMLMVFKVLGSIVLIVPYFKGRVKEWAYAGFVIDFLCASISIWAVDGFGGAVFFPLVVLAVLAVSYLSYHKMDSKI